MKKKFLLITLILTLILSVFVACKDNNDSSSDLGNGNSKYAILNDTYLQTDFENALTEISAEESKMSALTKVEDWAGGSKYKFTYANKMTLYVYCNMTSTVDSINYGDEKIYYRGYESYNINNYVYDDSYEYTLVFASEDYVKLYLNYPSTAKFPASNSWSISRYNDIYMLSSCVKASNAFGVESQYDFTTGFYVTEAEIKCIYLNIAGETKLNNINQYKPTTERKQVEPKYPNKNSNGNTDGINLVYGQLGTYGKNENDNGYSYIAYYVPSGRYTVINNGNMGTIFVSNDTDTRTYRFASGSMGETKEIVVPNGYYIELSMYTNITLQKIVENNNDSSTSSKPDSSDTENDGHNDIPYVVNHYIQNVDNEQYILYETENLKGTEDTHVFPAVKAYAGFTSPETQEIYIKKGGSLVVNYYYTRNTYTITYIPNGGEISIETQTVVFGSTITFPTATRVGYDFVGWYSDNALYQEGEWCYTDNIKLTAKWKPKNNVGYEIRHHLQNLENDNYTLDTVEELTGSSDSLVWPNVKTYEGFSAPSIQEYIISPDGSLVVDYYYIRNNYVITFITNGGTQIQEISQKYQATLSLQNAERMGYTFGGWFSDINLTEEVLETMPARDFSVYAWWKEEIKPVDFAYGGTSEIALFAYTGQNTVLWIPAYIGGIPVTEIMHGAFENKSMLKTVFVPNTVLRMGHGAFRGCNSIEDITLPFVGESINSTTNFRAVFGYIFGGVENQGLSVSGAVYQSDFWYSSYQRGFFWYYIPKTIKSITITIQKNIPQNAFKNCDFVETIILPQNTVSIGENAFENCMLIAEIRIPITVINVGKNAFNNCSSLKIKYEGISIPSTWDIDWNKNGGTVEFI